MSKGHQFFMNQVEIPSYSEFNKSHTRKLSTKFGQLVPVNVQEVYPSEVFKMNSEQLVRMAPMLAPVMDEVAIDINYFFVPFRILWSGWEDFITGESDEEHPYVSLLPGIEYGDLGDHLGYTPSGAGMANEPVSAFYAAAYTKIYDDWYRDQNLQPTQFPNDDLSPGDNSVLYGSLLANPALPGSLQHDYFTSCLPFPQKGPDVTIPVFENGFGTVTLDTNTENFQLIKDEDFDPSGATPLSANADSEFSNGSSPFYLDPNDTLIISEQEIGTIRALRLASVLQEWYERQAVGGSRYNETVLSNFGTNTGDARVDRAEHIGGYTQRIRFSEVLSTAETEAVPVGYMGGHGISYGQSRTYTYKAKEWGTIMGIMRIRPKTSYYQGLQRHMSRRDRFDYMWPTFAHVGDQSVLKKELFLGLDPDGVDTGATSEQLNAIFGYQERYAELKVGFDTVHGDFATSLDFWHMSRQFDAIPDLNFLFIRSDQDDYERIFNVQDGPDYLYIQIHNNVMALRPLPVYSDPTL